jgi:hypothetical protein
MHILIIEKDIGTEGFEYLVLFTPSQEKRLIDADTPEIQGLDHALVAGG